MSRSIGPPQVLPKDRGEKCTSKIFEELCAEHCIDYEVTAPYMHQHDIIA